MNTRFYDTEEAPQRNAIKCVNAARYGVVKIEDNFIEINSRLDRNGIYYERPISAANSGSLTNSIIGNIIDVKHMAWLDTTIHVNGIFVHGNKHCERDEVNIMANVITFDHLSYASRGIWAAGSSIDIINRGLLIKSNYIYLNASTANFHDIADNVQIANWGIGVTEFNSGPMAPDNGLKNTLEGNEVIASDIVDNTSTNDSYKNHNSAAFCGVYLSSSPHLSVIANIVDNTHRGFHSIDNVSFCDFRCNQMKTHTYGLNCDGGSNMSDQVHQGNIWNTGTGSYFFAGAYNGTNGPTLPPFRFFVNPAVAGLRPPSIVSSGTWFVNENLESKCGDDIPPPGPGDEDGKYKLSYIDEQTIVEDSLPLTVKTWDERRTLALRLLYAPVLTDSSTIAATWLSTASGTSAKLFAEATDTIKNAWASPTGWQSALISELDIRKEIEDSLVVKLAAIDISPTDSSLWQDYYGLLYDWEQANLNIDTFQEEITAFRHTNFQSILAIIAGLPDTTIYESNLKYILGHLVDVGLDIPISVGKLDSLFAIGRQCPTTDGISVRQALHWILFDNAMPYLAELPVGECDSTLWRSNPIPRIMEENMIRISPNPAANRIMVQGLGSIPVRWYIVNALGERLLEGESYGQSVLNIDVSQITTGLYFLIASSAVGRHSTARFLIVH